MPVKNCDKLFSKAVEKILSKVPLDYNGKIKTDEVYKALNSNIQKKVRKRMIYMYLEKKNLAANEDLHYSFQSPHISQNKQSTYAACSSNASSPTGSPSSPSSSSHVDSSPSSPADTAEFSSTTNQPDSNMKPSSTNSDQPNMAHSNTKENVKNSNSKLNRIPKCSPLENVQNKSEDRSKRVIKRKQVFDPSDFEKPTKEKKVVDESNENLCKVCGEEIDTLPPDTKPLHTIVCTGCEKHMAHGSCVRCEEQPWRCDSCKVCYVCQNKRPYKNESLLVCKLCKIALHERCSSSSINKTYDDWFCTNCATIMNDLNSFDRPKSEESNVPEVAKPKGRPSSKRHSKVEVSDEEQEQDIPDCSEWTPNQVHSYIKMFVPPQDAQIFLDQSHITLKKTIVRSPRYNSLRLCNGLSSGQYRNEIDGRSLQLLQRKDVLKNFNLKLGSALKLYASVKRLQERSCDIALCWG